MQGTWLKFYAQVVKDWLAFRTDNSQIGVSSMRRREGCGLLIKAIKFINTYGKIPLTSAAYLGEIL